MNTKAQKILSVAVAAGKVGMIYLVDGELMDWELSSTAALSSEGVKKKTQGWINFYQPDITVSELITKHSRKSDHTHGLIRAVARCAVAADTYHIEIERYATHANKYEEIKELCIQLPQIAAHAPTMPKTYMPEPKATIYFEALSMALQLGEPPTNLPV